MSKPTDEGKRMIEPATRPLMTVRDICERYGITRSVIDGLARDGLLTPHPAFTEGRWRRFRTVDVERLFEDGPPIDPQEAA